MSFKIYKYEQHEGGVFSKSNNLLNVQLPALEGVTNLDASYIELEGVSFYDNQGEQVTENVVLGYSSGAASVDYSASAFIKNLKITSSKQALIEEVRFVNRRTQSQHTLFKSDTSIKNEFFLGRGGPCLLDSDGKCNLQIPLKEVCGFGSIGSLPMSSLTGDVNFQIELENQNTVAAEYRMQLQVTNLNCNDITNNTEDQQDYNAVTITPEAANLLEMLVLFPIGSDLTVTYVHPVNGAQEDVVTIADVQVNGTACTLIFTEAFVTIDPEAVVTDITVSNNVVSVGCADKEAADPRNTLVAPAIGDDQVYPVGSVLLITCVTGAGVLRVFTGVVASTSVEGGNMTITFTKNILPEGIINEIYIRVAKFRNLDYKVEKVNIVVRNNPSATAPNSVTFDTYHLEMINMPPNYTDFRQQFDIEAGVKRLEWLTPVDSLVSVLDGVTSYRVSVNEVDTTNRDVEMDTGNNSLYYDKLMQAYSTQLVNLNMVNFSRDCFVVSEMLIPSEQRLMVNLRLYSDEPMDSKVVHLYKLITVLLQ